MQTQETELRDRFAMTALKGILSSPDYPRWDDYEAIAKDCYNIADAMKTERSKSQPAPDGEVNRQLYEALCECVAEIEYVIRHSPNSVSEKAQSRHAAATKALHNASEHNPATESSDALPEKWYIKRTPENAEMVNVWANSDGSGYVGKSGFMHSHKDHQGLYHCATPRNGYTEITTEQFRKHVAKS